VRSHTVRRGDTLAAIAKRYYGRATQWERIRDANHLTGTLIVPGQVLVVPE
jgi:nucleoid-associated protein YgaU